MKAYLTELIGTFFLVLAIGLTGNPIAIGTMLMVMVYMGGHISGAHYNPAVTIALIVQGAIEVSEAIKYMLFQLGGAILAALAVLWLSGNTFAPAPGAGVDMLQALGVEILFTFALVLVILNVAVSETTKGNSYYGLAIGFTVLAAAFAGGGISGGAYNPAVGLGPILVDALFGGGSFSHVWLYLVGPIAGGVLAAYVFKIQES